MSRRVRCLLASMGTSAVLLPAGAAADLAQAPPFPIARDDARCPAVADSPRWPHGCGQVVSFDSNRARYLVVFDRHASTDPASPLEIAATVVDAAGEATGSAFFMSDGGSGSDLGPAVAFNRATDEFLVAWQRTTIAGQHEIRARRVSAGTLTPVGSSIALVSSASIQINVVVAANPEPGASHRWLVAWQSASTVVATRLGGDGVPLQPVPIVVSADGELAGSPNVAFGDDGGYFLVYVGSTGGSQDVRLVRVFQDGSIEVVTTTVSEGSVDATAATPPGLAFNAWTRSLLITWLDYRSGWYADPNQVRFRIYSSIDGALLGASDSPLVPEGSQAWWTSASSLPGGGWLVAFGEEKTSGGTDLDLRGARVSPSGEVLALFTIAGSEAATSPVGDDYLQQLATNVHDGSSVAVWGHQSSTSTAPVVGARIVSGTSPVRVADTDFNADGHADYTIVRAAADGALTWYVGVAAVSLAVQWGEVGDVPVPGDYDGDGRTDLAVWRPRNGHWYVARSRDGATAWNWGSSADLDVPVPADYDGDGKVDIAVFRPGTRLQPATFYIVRSSTRTAVGVPWGTIGDLPVPADYDGDGKADVAVWRPSAGTFYVVPSTGASPYATRWGQPGDEPAIADYDGDGRADLAVYRAAGDRSRWFVIRSATRSTFGVAWGQLGDYAVAADYDGDARTDIAVWRPATPASTYYVIRSSGAPFATHWGTAFDLPVAR